jgi:hypothetical protein
MIGYPREERIRRVKRFAGDVSAIVLAWRPYYIRFKYLAKKER